MASIIVLCLETNLSTEAAIGGWCRGHTTKLETFWCILLTSMGPIVREDW